MLTGVIAALNKNEHIAGLKLLHKAFFLKKKCNIHKFLLTDSLRFLMLHLFTKTTGADGSIGEEDGEQHRNLFSSLLFSSLLFSSLLFSSQCVLFSIVWKNSYCYVFQAYEQFCITFHTTTTENSP
jgi:hypothetical protein